jgi:hypothetical protein
MLRKIISLATLICFIFYLCGCSSIEVVNLCEGNIDKYKDSDIVASEMNANEIYEFETSDNKPKPEIRDSVLVGWAIGRQIGDSYEIKEAKIPISEIRTMWIKEPYEDMTDLLVCGGIIVLSVIVMIGFSKFVDSMWNFRN